MTSTARTILESLVKVPSVTGEEMRLADTVAGWCRAAGLETVLREIEPGRPNVVAHRRTGRRPVLLMTGHLDTVPVGEGWTRDPFGADVESGRLYGRGASDMKAGLAAMLAALVDLHAAGEQPAGDVVFAGVIGEEEDSAGTLALIADGITADRALLAEPTALELIRSGRGIVNYTLTIAGASAHASSPQLGRNAIVAAAHVVQALEQLSARLAERPHPAFGPPNLTVGTIHGGTRPYVVPDLCVVEVDRRVNPGESPEMVRAEAEAVLEAVRQRIPWLVADFTFGSEYFPFELAEDDPLVQSALAAMRAAGLQPRVGTWRAASDAGLLVGRAGIPCVLFGPGDTSQAHRPDEFVDLAEVEVASQVCSRLLKS